MDTFLLLAEISTMVWKKKKPGASWRTAENFKYPSWQQPKLSARIYRAAAHVFSLLCTRMPLSRKRREEKKRREKKEKNTYI